ncbi:MAG: amidohydrolase [Deltaproteobacteria bacterium]|nr:amidohydrolase [Deltaproteobacteria bacterium]
MPKIDTSATPAWRWLACCGVKLLKEKDYLLLGARVWESGNDSLSPLSSPLRVREDRIVAVGPAALEGASEAHRLELPGRVIVPGLIDAHVHLELDPVLRTPAEQLAVPEPDRIAAMEARGRAMLFAGITTARDCGGGRHREHALRARIDAGLVRGPRLLCCGQPLTSPAGHCSFWGAEVSTPDEIARAVARQIEAGSDWIKLMATGGIFTPGSRARDTQFEQTAMQSVVAAAARAGRSVAAHCHGTRGIAAAVRAGARTIEHASFAGEKGFATELDESLMREMAQTGVWVSPTVNAGWGRRIVDEQGEPTDFFLRMSRCLRSQRAQGVRFIASTDAGIPGVAHPDLLDGLVAFAHFAALRPVDALRAATSEAATALGIADRTGSIEAGLSADLLVVESDPLVDLEALRDPEVVVFRGEWLDRSVRGGGPILADAAR